MTSLQEAVDSGWKDQTLDVRPQTSVPPETMLEPPPAEALILPWIFASVDYLGTRKLLGEKAECAFLYQAMEHGLIVSKPYGDSAPYDFVVGTRQKAKGRRQKAGVRLWKVQVKSVQGKDPQGRYSVNLRKSFSRRYERGEIDFFAVWIIGAATWYIVPGSEVFPAKGGHFYPDVKGSRGKYERYREAWEQLKN
jgi:PD-(D/E)XK nuclease superfamily protein